MYVIKRPGLILGAIWATSSETFGLVRCKIVARVIIEVAREGFYDTHYYRGPFSLLVELQYSVTHVQEDALIYFIPR